MTLGYIALIIIHNRKRAEVAGKAKKKRGGHYKYKLRLIPGEPDPSPVVFVSVVSQSPFSPFPVFAPLFHTSYSGYDFFFKIDELTKATNPGDNEKLKKRDPFETRLRKVLAKKNCYL